jgi:hypothetical protein
VTSRISATIEGWEIVCPCAMGRGLSRYATGTDRMDQHRPIADSTACDLPLDHAVALAGKVVHRCA